jgi:hypothetical protein
MSTIGNKEPTWSEWLDWDQDDLYDTIYHEVPGSNWNDVEIEFEHEDGHISKAYMVPCEECTTDYDDCWKSYDLQDENYKWPCNTKGVKRWRYLNDWE